MVLATPNAPLVGDEDLRRGPHRVHVEPSPRRVRVMVDGETVADSRSVLLVRETRHMPVYYFPPEDLRTELLEPTDLHTTCPYKGEASYWTIRIGERVIKDAVWSYLDPLPDRQDIRGYRAFYWNRVDAWYEEDEQVFVHPRNPYARVDALRSSRPVRVELDGVVLAESASTVMVFETGLPTRYYFERMSVNFDVLTPSATVTECPYKGRTSAYWTSRIGVTSVPDIAWSYDFPTRALSPIANLVAFYNELTDLTVGGKRLDRPASP